MIRHDADSGNGARCPPPIGGLTIKQTAEAFGVSVRNLERARFICRYGIPEIEAAVRAGSLDLGPAEAIARFPRDRQLAELQHVLANPAKKRKRPPRTIKDDAQQIEDLIDRLARRWSPDDRWVMGIVLRQLADHLLGIVSDDEGDDTTCGDGEGGTE